MVQGDFFIDTLLFSLNLFEYLECMPELPEVETIARGLHNPSLLDFAIYARDLEGGAMPGQTHINFRLNTSCPFYCFPPSCHPARKSQDPVLLSSLLLLFFSSSSLFFLLLRQTLIVWLCWILRLRAE